MKKIKIKDFKVTKAIKISDSITRLDFDSSEIALEESLVTARKKLGELQETLYAHGKYAVLVCLQGMDTSGKDSLIREVFKDINAMGVIVHSFKVPTDLERGHDYLWRHYIALPQRGKFAVFNRTHYENVLVTRVHPNYILGELLPNIKGVEDVNEAFWDKRFEQINSFEKTISENGTLIFKFFLNLSKEEQKNRLLRRLNMPNKNWKFSASDLDERDLWEKYMVCYEDTVNRTSKSYAPWYLIPADNKPAARLIVATILLKELKKYKDIKEPELDPKIKDQITIYKERLSQN